MTSTPISQSARLPRLAGLTGLALAAVSTGFVSSAAPAHATIAAGQNGPISITAFKSPPGAVQNPSVWQDVNPDGSGLLDVPVGTSPLTVPSGQGAVSVSGGVFSPDGTMAYYRDDFGCYYLTKADGTDPRPVTGIVTMACNGGVANPVLTGWTPDNRLVFQGSDGTVTAIRPDGSGASVLGHLPGSDYQLASVSPSGALALIDHSDQVYILAPGSTTPSPVGAGDLAAFSPDGSKLAVVDLFGRKVVIYDGNGSNPAPLTQFSGNTGIDGVCWSPDGTEVAYSTGGSVTDGTTLYTQTITPGSTPNQVLHSADLIQVGSWHNGPLLPAPTADRIGGADRIATAIDASQWSYNDFNTGGRQATSAVISRSDQFADALGGSALAAQKGGPLLLTATAGLDPRVGAELHRILAPGATVYVLGGSSALSQTVDQAIRALNLVPQRLAGTDRFSTSVQIAGAVNAHPHTVMVATGTDFPDPLTAGAAAAQDPAGGIVVLTNGTAMPAATKSYLTGIDPHTTDVYAVGGPGKTALLSAFPQWSSSITPLVGTDRFTTAADVATSRLFAGRAPIGRVGLATGTTWPDALSGGSLIATQHGPLLLTSPTSDYLPAPELDVIRALAPHLSGIVAFGGTNAVDASVFADTATSAFGPGGFFNSVNRSGPMLASAR